MGKRNINVQEQKIEPLKHSVSIPIYTFDGETDIEKSTITLPIGDSNKNLIGLLAEQDIEPIFKKGSVFVVNKDLTPEDGNLIAIKIEPNGLVLIRKFHKKNNKINVSLFDKFEEKIDLSTLKYYVILGVVIQVIAKT